MDRKQQEDIWLRKPNEVSGMQHNLTKDLALQSLQCFTQRGSLGNLNYPPQWKIKGFHCIGPPPPGTAGDAAAD